MAWQRTPRRRATAWTALLALLAALWLPTLVRATLDDAVPAWTEVCTAEGSRYVAVAADGSPLSSPHGAWEHCPWCLKPQAAPPPAHGGRPEPWAGSSLPAPAREAQRVAAFTPGRLPPPRGPPAPARG